MTSGAIDGLEFTTLESIRDWLFYPLVAIGVLIVGYTFGEVMIWSILAWVPGYDHPADRIYHIVGGMVVALLVVSLFVQLIRPREGIGTMLLAVAIGFAMTVVAVAIDGLSGVGAVGMAVIPIGVIALIHPARDRLTVYQSTPARRHLFVGVAGGLFFGYSAMALIAEHPTSEIGYHVLLPAGVMTIALASLLVPVRSTDWRPLGWAIGLVGGGYAVGSLVFPGADGALPPVTALIVVAYVVVVVLGRERSDRQRSDR